MTTRTVALTAARRRTTPWVRPLMVAAVVLLVAGLWEGLVYLGLPLPAGATSLQAGHGPIMVLGFLGTVIALERAVALGDSWAYLAPAGAAAGGLAVAGGAPNGIGQALITGAGIVLVAVFVTIHRIQPSMHNAVMALGAGCWVVAGALWLDSWDVPRFVPWLVGFLVITIAGERLELSRMIGTTRFARWLFGSALAAFVIGLLVSLPDESVGVRIAGVGLLGLACWLLRFDVARRTVHARGVTRYMAASLLAGYGWLAIAGGLWLAVGRMVDGWAYDAMLHAVFLGFVISMIFAHLPVIIPAVLGRPLRYHPGFYVPLVLLHTSLILRLLGGDAAHNRLAWQWGGSLNEVALLLFLGMAALAVWRGRIPINPGRPARR